MSAEELRELADWLAADDYAAQDRYRAAAYLRACADALDAGPVAWQHPGPVTREHPLECLVVVPALRQADGDWWLYRDVFLDPDSPIAWMPDTREHRAMLDAAPTPPVQDDEALEVLRELVAAEAETQRLRESLRGLLAVTSSKAPGTGLIVGAEDRHAAAIKQARAALENTDAR